MEDQAPAEDDVVEAVPLGVQVVDRPEHPLNFGRTGLQSKFDRPVEVIFLLLVPFLFGELPAQDIAHVVVAPLGELHGGYLRGPPSFELQGEEAVAGPYVQDALPAEVFGNPVVGQQGPQVVLARGFNTLGEFYGVVPVEFPNPFL